jgi:hypothetical protein
MLFSISCATSCSNAALSSSGWDLDLGEPRRSPELWITQIRIVKGEKELRKNVLPVLVVFYLILRLHQKGNDSFGRAQPAHAQNL